jgi:hypothetical protein
VYWKIPEKEIRIVRPDNAGDVYELWVLTPKYIGSIEKAGTQRLIANGTPYTNLNAAARILLEDAGEREVASGLVVTRKQAPKVVEMQGMDLVSKNVWPKFCEIRRIDPRSMEALNKSYKLSEAELTILGVKE